MMALFYPMVYVAHQNAPRFPNVRDPACFAYGAHFRIRLHIGKLGLTGASAPFFSGSWPRSSFSSH